MIFNARNATIDGARGYLALAVLCHHFLICWIYFRTGTWAEPPVTLFRNLGPVAVGMFFMITAFLFYRKLLHSVSMDWVKLYRGRLFRLTPMYLVAVSAVMLIVAIQTDFQLRVEGKALLDQIVRWATFTMLGAPDVNGLRKTENIIAGATWSLRYEWLFYLGLPALAVGLKLVGERKRVRILILILVSIVISLGPDLALMGIRSSRFLPFALGMLTVEMVTTARVRAFAASAYANPVLIGLLLLAALLPVERYGLVQMAFVGSAFLLIAAGADLSGVLTARISKILGDASYSIYLLHGIALFLIFSLLASRGVSLSGQWIWLLLPLAMVLVSAISIVTYRWIEKPFIDLGQGNRLPVAGTLTTREVAP